MKKIKAKFIDEFVTPIIDRVGEILIAEGLISPCLCCGNTYTTINTDDEYTYYKITCDCGAINKESKMLIYDLLTRKKD